MPIKADLAKTVGQWDYVFCYTLIKLPSSGGVHVSCKPECDACGNTNLRFVHILEHVETGRLIDVGIECACVLLEDDDLPRLAENEVKRKERWRIFYRKPGRCVVGLAELEKRGKL